MGIFNSKETSCEIYYLRNVLGKRKEYLYLVINFLLVIYFAYVGNIKLKQCYYGKLRTRVK